MASLYEVNIDSDSRQFGTFILYRVRELYGVGDYPGNLPKYAERVNLSLEDLKKSIRGDILPNNRIIQDMMESDTIEFNVSVSHKYTIRSIERTAGFKIEDEET